LPVNIQVFAAPNVANSATQKLTLLFCCSRVQKSWASAWWICQAYCCLCRRNL